MEIIYTTIGTTVLMAILAFLLKNIIITRLINAVKHEYDEKLEEIKAKNSKDNNVLLSNLRYLSDTKLQKNSEARKIKQDYYHIFLESLSVKLSHLNKMHTEDAILANRKFCIEFNRLPLYASQEVVEFLSKNTKDTKALEFTELYELIRKDLCSDTYDDFENLLSFPFQIPFN